MALPSFSISIENNIDSIIEFVIFGGEKYNESVVMGGPFVMNTTEEMMIANRDYQSGKYGSIER